MINDKKLSDYVANRYEDWQKDLGNFIHTKGTSLESIHQKLLMKILSQNHVQGTKSI